MKFALLLLTITLAALAQQKGAPALPPLVACGPQGDLEIVCGTRSPEDLELAPDGKSLLVSQFLRGAGGAGISLFDLAKKTFTLLPTTAEPLKDWGDAACPGPIGDALAPHGTTGCSSTWSITAAANPSKCTS